MSGRMRATRRGPKALRRPGGAALAVAVLAVVLGSAAAADGAGLRVRSRLVLSEAAAARATGAGRPLLRSGTLLHAAWVEPRLALRGRTLDLATGGWSEAADLGWAGGPEHGMAMAVDAGGLLHLVLSPSRGVLELHVGKDAGKLTDLIPQGPLGDGLSSPAMVIDAGGVLHVVCRQAPLPHRLAYLRRAVGGPWSEPAVLVDSDPADGALDYAPRLELEIGRAHV